MKKILIVAAALVGALNLSGCMVVMAGGGYHGDHGDLVSSDGSVRYVGWCALHVHNSHCLDTGVHAAVIQPPSAGAVPTAAVALTPNGSPPEIADVN